MSVSRPAATRSTLTPQRLLLPEVLHMYVFNLIFLLRLGFVSYVACDDAKRVHFFPVSLMRHPPFMSPLDVNLPLDIITIINNNHNIVSLKRDRPTGSLITKKTATSTSATSAPTVALPVTVAATAKSSMSERTTSSPTTTTSERTFPPLNDEKPFLFNSNHQRPVHSPLFFTRQKLSSEYSLYFTTPMDSSSSSASSASSAAPSLPPYETYETSISPPYENFESTMLDQQGANRKKPNQSQSNHHQHFSSTTSTIQPPIVVTANLTPGSSIHSSSSSAFATSVSSSSNPKRPPIRITHVNSNKVKQPDRVHSPPLMVMDPPFVPGLAMKLPPNTTVIHSNLIVPLKPGRPHLTQPTTTTQYPVYPVVAGVSNWPTQPAAAQWATQPSPAQWATQATPTQWFQDPYQHSQHQPVTIATWNPFQVTSPTTTTTSNPTFIFDHNLPQVISETNGNTIDKPIFFDEIFFDTVTPQSSIIHRPSTSTVATPTSKPTKAPPQQSLQAGQSQQSTSIVSPPKKPSPTMQVVTVTPIKGSNEFIVHTTTPHSAPPVPASSQTSYQSRPSHQTSTPGYVNAIWAPPMPSRPFGTQSHRPLQSTSSSWLSPILNMFAVENPGGVFGFVTILKTVLFTVLVMFLPPLTLAAAVMQAASG